MRIVFWTKCGFLITFFILLLSICSAQDIDELVEALRNADPEVRKATALTLGDIGPDARKAVPKLIEALQQDEDAIVRAAAARTLGKIGFDGSVIDLLVRTINTAGQELYNNKRLRGIAQLFHDDSPSQIGLIGTTDPRPDMEGCLSVPPGKKADHGTACLAFELAREFGVTDVKAKQARNKRINWSHGDAGVVAGPEWTMKEWERFKFGRRWWYGWTWGTKMIEVVLEHNNTGDKLRFYSVYFYAGTSAKEKRTLQAFRASQIIRDRAEPGELPPIVVGDFNASYYFNNRAEKEESMQIMERNFWLPIDDWNSRFPGEVKETGIDIIYIGKRETGSFPYSKDVTIVPVKLHDINMKQSCSVEGYPDFSYQLTDHNKSAGVMLKIVPSIGISPIVVRNLVSALKDPHESVRKAAAEALEGTSTAVRDSVPGPFEEVAWSNWRSLCRPLKIDGFRRLAVGQGGDGALELFALDNVNRLWHVWQVAPNATSWPQWNHFPRSLPGLFHNLAVASNEDGRLEVFGSSPIAVGFKHAWHSRQAGGDWNNWENLITNPVKDLVVGRDLDVLEVFTTSLNGVLWHTWQQAPNGEDWSGQESLGRPPNIKLKILAVARNEDRRLEVFAIGDSGKLWHIWQAPPGVSWSDWASLGNPHNIRLDDLAVAKDKERNLHVFAIGNSGKLWHIWQTLSGDWSDWLSRGPNTGLRLQAVTVAQNEDGGLAVFALGGGGVWHKYQKTLFRWPD